MRESGYYPAGAEFDVSAPWNLKENSMRACPICEGSGIEYTGTPGEGGVDEDKLMEIVCQDCNGDGVEEADDYDLIKNINR